MLEWIGWDDYSVLDRIQFGMSVISVIGIAAIYTWFRRIFAIWRPGRKIVRFKSALRQHDALTIVISTSEKHDPTEIKRMAGAVEVQKKSKPWKAKLKLAKGDDVQVSNGPRYPRPTVSVWTTYAVTEITEVSSMLGYRKSFETDIAERLTHNQSGDLVLIGGRIKNIRSKQFSDHFNACYPELAITRSMDGLSEVKKLKIGNEEFNFVPTKDEETGHTVSDRAILMLWRNPFREGKRRRRGILCAGFTSMGTAGAAQYLSDSLQNGSLRKMWRAQRPRGWSQRRFPQFIVVLDVYINNDRYLDVYPVKLIPITENGTTSRRSQIHGRDAIMGH